MTIRSDNRLLFAIALSLVLLISDVAPVVADYTPPGGPGSGSITLGESPATTYSITAPDDIIGWQLSPFNDPNIHVGILKVNANGNWQVAASDTDTSHTDGHMTEWDSSSYYTSNKLASPMKVSVQSGGNVSTGYEVTLPNGGKIADGGSTEGADKNVDVTFKQPVSWNDKALTNGHSYRMVITFTISPYS